MIVAVKKYEDMDSCCRIYVCDKNGNRIQLLNIGFIDKIK